MIMEVVMMIKPEMPAAPESNALSRVSFFGPAPIIAGEDTEAYDDLFARVSGDVRPADIIEEIWVRDIVDLTWEIFRWRRLKTALLSAATPEALREVLAPLMRAESSAEYKLVKKLATGNPAAITRFNKLMASANLTMDTVMARALVTEFDHIERIDRLMTIAEGRRNIVLREIDRHRSTFGQVMRERVRDVAEAEFEIVEQKTVT
jgi:hypothetical protein